MKVSGNPKLIIILRKINEIIIPYSYQGYLGRWDRIFLAKVSRNIRETLNVFRPIVSEPQIFAADVKECVMQNIETHEEDLIDLGVATEETKGGAFGVLDVQQSLYIIGGISDD